MDDTAKQIQNKMYDKSREIRYDYFIRGEAAAQEYMRNNRAKLNTMGVDYISQLTAGQQKEFLEWLGS